MPPKERPSSPIRSRAGRALLLVVFWSWVPSLVIPGVYFLAWHTLTLPAPDRGSVTAAVELHRRLEDRGRWSVLHVLYSGCGCSARVLERLAGRRPIEGVPETILFVDGAPGELAEQAHAAGFRLESLTRDDLVQRYHLEAAPLLVIADGDGAIRYLGGYTERKQSPEIQDVAILERLRRGEEVSALPLFGCAVSRDLQSKLDPLKLKY